MRTLMPTSCKVRNIMSNVILKMSKITKLFGPVKALDQVDFDLREGEVHALLGENGSGKSTLIKVLGGIHTAESGEIYLDGKQVHIPSVAAARENRISIVHQELSFAPMMTVAENVFMGRELRKKSGFIDRKRMLRETKALLEDFGSDIHPDALMNDLSVSQQQVVEIVKALSNNARIVAMDEPSASLSLKEVESLYKTVDRLKELKISVIYVSHRMEELFRLSDRVTVLRDGAYIGTCETAKTNNDELVKMMVGRELDDSKMEHVPGDEVVLEIKNLSRGNLVRNVNLKAHKGEIVGLSGIVGAGRSGVARIIMGVDKGYEGEILLDGKPMHIRNTVSTVKQGIVLVPENRKTEGLVLGQTVNFNTTISVLHEFIKGFMVNRKKEYEITDQMIRLMHTKVSSREQKAGNLSGGNQQKVVLGKWLATKPRVIILDEPTKGIDVGAKAEIYALMDKLAGDGVTILVISSDLPELLRVSDRIYVMTRGETVAEFAGDAIDQEEIIKYATGVDKNE